MKDSQKCTDVAAHPTAAIVPANQSSVHTYYAQTAWLYFIYAYAQQTPLQSTTVSSDRHSYALVRVVRQTWIYPTDRNCKKHFGAKWHSTSVERLTLMQGSLWKRN